MKTVSLLIALCFAGAPAFGQNTLTGLELQDECRVLKIGTDSETAVETVKDMACTAYVQGIIDGWELAGGKLCIPNAATFGEEAQVVGKYLDDHPNELHLTPADLVMSALSSAWPCKEAAKPQ